MINKQKVAIIIVISFLLSAANSVSYGATYFLDASTGDDGGDGTLSSPWKTLAKAKSVVASGDTVYLQTGEYGVYTETSWATRNAYITYSNYMGSSPHITHIGIGPATPTDSYLIFNGINIKPVWVDPCSTAQTGCSDPQYASSTQSTYAKTSNAVDLTHANHVKVTNCIIEGQNKHLTPYGVSINAGHDVTIDHCSITKVQRGVNMAYASTGDNVLNNHIHGITSSAIVQGGVGCTGLLVEGNHAHDSGYSTSEDYAPRLVGQEYHGSAIALRDGYATIRNNVFHNGFPSAGIMTYLDGSGHYDNIVIENNLLYSISTMYVLRFYLMGDNTIVRNNTLISTYRGGNDGRYLYNTALAVHSLDTDGSPHLTLQNNILIGMTAFEEGSKLTQNNNIFYSWSDWGAENEGWECTPNNGSYVMTCTYADHPTTEVTTLFKCGAECTFLGVGYIGSDYTLAEGSQAINFGNVGAQPTDSLGTIGADGFLIANGSPRTGSNHNAGAYEKVFQKIRYRLSGSFFKLPNE